MIAIETPQTVIPRGRSEGSWEDILGRVLGGINGAANPGQVTVGGSTPQVYAPGSSAATDYMPLILIALVVVAIVVLAKR